MASLTPAFFDSPADLRRWLAANHDKVAELLIGFYKRDSVKQLGDVGVNCVGGPSPRRAATTDRLTAESWRG